MDMVLERLETAILTLHMNIMRKSIKRGLKSNYGLFEGKKKLKFYDSIKEKLMIVLQNADTKEEVIRDCFSFSDNEMVMLHSFLNWYSLEIELSAEEQGVDPEKDEQILIIRGLKDKINSLVEITEEEVS